MTVNLAVPLLLLVAVYLLWAGIRQLVVGIILVALALTLGSAALGLAQLLR